MVDVLVDQPFGQSGGLPLSQLGQARVGDGRRVDDQLRSGVADEDDVHDGGGYRRAYAGSVAGAPSTPASMSVRFAA